MPDLRKDPGGKHYRSRSMAQRAVTRRMRAAWDVKGASIRAHCYMCAGAHPWGEPCDGPRAATRNLGQHLKRSR